VPHAILMDLELRTMDTLCADPFDQHKQLRFWVDRRRQQLGERSFTVIAIQLIVTRPDLLRSPVDRRDFMGNFVDPQKLLRAIYVSDICPLRRLSQSTNFDCRVCPWAACIICHLQSHGTYAAKWCFNAQATRVGGRGGITSTVSPLAYLAQECAPLSTRSLH
jgi:hypothetical protein